MPNSQEDSMEDEQEPAGGVSSGAPPTPLPSTSGGLQRAVGIIDIDKEDDEWDAIEETFGQKASLVIAKIVLGIFGVVYGLCFVIVALLFSLSDVTFDGGVEVLRFMLSSIIPLVTLAVGYYLGDRSNSNTS